MSQQQSFVVAGGMQKTMDEGRYPVRVFNFGGGVQSTASLVLAAQGKIDWQTFLFANVGEDSEYPGTLRYVREIALPYAAQHGIRLIERQRISSDGQPQTILTELKKNKYVLIPMYIGQEGQIAKGTPLHRSCTSKFKVEVAERWLKEERGISAILREERKTKEKRPRPLAITALGISMDEWQRMRSDSGNEWQQLDYPLIRLRLTRMDCIEIIRKSGLPIPPKSSCWFCPYHSLQTWQKRREEEPEIFAQAVQLEQDVNAFRKAQGYQPVWLTSRTKPLNSLTTELHQEALFDGEDVCDGGYCFV